MLDCQEPIGEGMWEIGGTKFREDDMELLLSIQKKPTGIAYVYLEPFMEIEKYYGVIRTFHAAGGHQHMYTNGTLATEEKLRALGVPCVAIGDLGNEIGMGKIADHIRSFVPFTAHGECICGCKGGILAASTADSIITATSSDWGCYGLMAALAYLLRNIDILHPEEMEAAVMRTAARSGMIDMTGSLLPGIDGFNLKMNVSILSLMRQCTDYALRYSHNSDRWFGPVLAMHFFV